MIQPLSNKKPVNKQKEPNLSLVLVNSLIVVKCNNDDGQQQSINEVNQKLTKLAIEQNSQEQNLWLHNYGATNTNH